MLIVFYKLTPNFITNIISKLKMVRRRDLPVQHEDKRIVFEREKDRINILYPKDEDVRREFLWDNNGDLQGWDDNYYNGEGRFLQKTYWPNGNIYCMFPFVDGKVQGIIQEWDEDGVLVRRKMYINGVEAPNDA